VRNDAERLQRCLASIRAGSYPRDRIEIIVVDNGSSDGSAQAARRAGAKVLVLPDVTVSELRNRGAAIATGGVLAFVDADHEIVRQWAEHAVETLAGKGVAAVGAHYEAPRDGTWVQRTYDLLRHRSHRTHDVEWLGSGNVAMWRTAFEAAGRFDTGLQTCEDVDLCNRLRGSGQRIVHDPRLGSVHHGDPATLAAVFRGELWRGRDNLRASLRGPLTIRELPSVVVPILVLLLLSAALIGFLVGGFVGLALFVLGIGGMLAAAAARAARMLSRTATWSPRMIGQALLVATTYDLARAMALVRPGGHEARRKDRR
jgi:hypothetical protein